jgi:predicted nucleic acid-binding Zn ribbon protein
MNVEYFNDGKIAYYNGHRFTRDDRTGYYLSSHKIGECRIRLHIYVYQCERGRDVPEGWSIHHIDGNKNHNDINNLACIPQYYHASYHSKKNFEENSERAIQILDEIRPKTKAWHASAEGHEWHKKHYEKMKDALYVQHTFKCIVCGKEFQSSQIESKFCCNAHKSQYRRDAHLDDEKRICIICGEPFMINKYAKTKTCSRECGGILKRITKRKNKEAAS